MALSVQRSAGWAIWARRTMGTVVALALAVGCTGLRPGQREDMMRWEGEAARLGDPTFRAETQHYDPDHARHLGFLPFGLAGFYIDNPGLAVSGFVWPVSIFWLPQVAQARAERKNYLEARARILALREDAQGARNGTTGAGSVRRVPVDPRVAAKQLQRLEKLWNAGRISESDYLAQRRQIEESLSTGEQPSR